MAVVFDSSGVIACLSPDESPPPDWPELLSTQDLYAPAIWPTEIVNVLLVARRRKRLTQNDLNRSLLALGRLSVEIEPGSVHSMAGSVLKLAETHQLTMYDAAYLELSIRRTLPLATLNKKLRTAAKKLKVDLL